MKTLKRDGCCTCHTMVSIRIFIMWFAPPKKSVLRLPHLLTIKTPPTPITVQKCFYLKVGKTTTSWAGRRMKSLATFWISTNVTATSCTWFTTMNHNKSNLKPPPRESLKITKHPRFFLETDNKQRKKP